VNPLEAFCAAGRAMAAAARGFGYATAHASKVARAVPPARPETVAAAWRAKDRAAAELTKAEHALHLAAIAYDAAIGGAG